MNFVDGHREPGLAGQLLFDRFDNVMRHERFAVVLADVAVRVEAGLAPEVTGELAAVVVLDNDDLLAAREDAADLRGVERDDPFDVKLIGHDSFLAGEFLDGFANHALGRTPADQRHGGVFRTDELRRGDVVDRGLHLAAAFLDHHAALVRVGEFIADERAVFVVLVGGGGEDVTGHAGHRARRDAALGVLEAQVGVVVVAAGGVRAVAVAVRQNQLAAIDLHVEVEVVRINARGAFGDEQVGQDQAGALVFVAEVEQLRDRLKQIELARRRDDDARIIALPGAEHLPEIALLGLGGHAGGRAGALHIDADDRRFNHARHADGLRHQGKAAAAGRAHGPATGVGRADDHVHHADFVLDLPDHDAELPRVRRHPHQHAGGRAHRVSRVKFHARRRAAHGGGLVAGDDA